MKRFLRSLTVGFTCATALSACSASVFNKETTEFATAASGIEGVWVELHDKSTLLRQEARDRERIAGAWRFQTTAECGRVSQVLSEPPSVDPDLKGKARADALAAELSERRALLDGCLLFRLGGATPAGIPEAARVQVTPTNRDLLVYTNVITKYARGLQALSTAEDEQDLRDATARIASAFSTSAEAVRKASGDNPIEIAGPITAATSLLTELALAGISQAKYAALKRIVEETDPVIARMSERLAEGEPLLRSRLLEQLYARSVELNDALEALPEGTAQKVRTDLQERSIAAHNAFTSYAGTLVGGGASYLQLADTHAALVDAIKNPDKPDLVIEFLKRFNRVADSAKAARDAFSKASN